MTATAYLMLARHFDGRPLGFTIASEKTLASHGSYRWELAPKPYAEVTAETLDRAQHVLLRKLVTDVEPWPDDLVPLVQALLQDEVRVKPKASPYRQEANPDDAPVAFESTKGRSRRGRIERRIEYLDQRCSGGVARGEASALRWILALADRLERRVSELEDREARLEDERREAVRVAELRGSQLEAANREISMLRAVIDPEVRQACSCCRKCGPTVPCAAAIESMGEDCEGRCYCGVDGQIELPVDDVEEDPCEA